MNFQKIVPQIIYSFVLIYLVSIIIYFPKWIVDDAFIIFRYSENFANNYQQTWNLNYQPVDGYTGIVLLLIIAFFMKLSVSPVFISHFLGIFSFFTGGVFFYLLLKKMKLNNIAISISVALFLSTPFYFTHIFSGLETTLFTAGIIIVLFLLREYLGRKNQINAKSIFLFLSLMLLSLVRPEGIILSVLSIIVIINKDIAENKKVTAKLIFPLFFIMIIPLSLFFFWRWNYYGFPLPNTFYVKVSLPEFSEQSLNNFKQFLSEYVFLPFLTGFLLILLDVDRVWSKIKNHMNISLNTITLVMISLLFSLILILVYLKSNLFMNYSFRFFSPVYPVLLIFLAVILSEGLNNLVESKSIHPIRDYSYIIIIAIILLVHFYSFIGKLHGEVYYAERYKKLMENVHIPTGKFINENIPSSEWLIVNADAGAIPFYSKLKTIDFGQLNDKYLAHKQNITGEEIADYFFSFNAGVAVFTSFNSDSLQRDNTSLGWLAAKKIISDKRFSNYKIVKKIGTKDWNYFEFVYFRKDLIK